MSLADRLTGSHDYYSRKCRVCTITDEMEGSEREALTRALASTRVSTVRIYRALVEEGYAVSYSTVTRHRSLKHHEPSGQA